MGNPDTDGLRISNIIDSEKADFSPQKLSRSGELWYQWKWRRPFPKVCWSSRAFIHVMMLWSCSLLNAEMGMWLIYYISMFTFKCWSEDMIDWWYDWYGLESVEGMTCSTLTSTELDALARSNYQHHHCLQYMSSSYLKGIIYIIMLTCQVIANIIIKCNIVNITRVITTVTLDSHHHNFLLSAPSQ